MQFKIEDIKAEYENSRTWQREAGKWLFSICTLGLGGIYLWATTRIIANGEIGIRESLNGDMILLPPGRHSNFPWESYPYGPQKISESYIEMGPYKIFTVKTGYAAETNKHGILQMFEPGQYIIRDQAHTFGRTVSTRLETKKLDKVQAYTQDNVGLSLQADVRYRIQNPELAIREISNIEQYITETSEMKIANIIGHHNLSEFAPAISRFEVGKGKQEIDAESHNGSGLSNLLLELTNAIKEQFEALGILLDSIGITSWSIDDKQLAHELAQGAVVNSQTQSKMITAHNDAKVCTIAVETEAKNMKTLAEAESEVIKIKGQAITDVAKKLDNPIAHDIYKNNQNIALVHGAKQATLFFNAEPQRQTPKLVTNIPLTSETNSLSPTGS